MRIVIKNGHILDPATGRDGLYDLLVEDGKISRVEKAASLLEETSVIGFYAMEEAAQTADRVIDAKGLYVMPGFIDLHVHFRDPGLTYKETIRTGSQAAARGGFTTVCTMPNTVPVMDTTEHLAIQLTKIQEEAVVHVLPIGAVTMGQEGKELSEIEAMQQSGIVALSEDGKSVMDAGLYRKAMQIAAKRSLPVFAHCEDKTLVAGGVLNAGKKAEELGVPSISNAVEDVICARDILLAKETGVRLHLCHCSTADSVKMVKLAKEDGLPVTAEVCPHHFTLTEEDILRDDANYKMNPPLRSRQDVDALIEGLQNGVIDVIATDHAPHSAEEKAKSIKDAPFGIVGLETAFALAVSELVKKNILTPMELVEKMSKNPAKVLGIPKGTLEEGTAADIVIVDMDAVYQIQKETFVSKGKNTPFEGRTVSGKICYTLVDGKVVYEA